MNKIQKLIALCKADINILINNHKSCYESVSKYLANYDHLDEDDLKHLDKMIDNDTIIELIFYPDTPVGNYTIFHYNIDMALDEALEILEYKENNYSK